MWQILQVFTFNIKIILYTFDIAPHKCKTNSYALVMNIGKMLIGILRHRRGISSSVEGTIQYNHQVKSVARVASML